MTFLEKIEQIKRIDQLIRIKATGTPQQLASKLDMSERAVYDRINLMKSMGAPIEYSHVRQCYYYQGTVQCEFGFFLTEGDAYDQIVGGKSIFFKNILGLQKFCSESVYV